MPMATTRGGAPAWRRVLISLGFDDTDPSKDAQRAFQVSAQIGERTPSQLLSALDVLSSSLEAFDAIIEEAVHCRSHQKKPEGAEATRINELLRFVTVANDAVHGMLNRRAHDLDDRDDVQALYEAASSYAVIFDDRAVERGLLRDAAADDDLWAEAIGDIAQPTPPNAPARTRASRIAAILTVIIEWLLERFQAWRSRRQAAATVEPPEPREPGSD